MITLPRTRLLFALSIVTPSFACGPSSGSEAGSASETGSGSDTGSDTGEPVGCDRVEGDQPTWALRCGGPASDRVIGLGVGGDNLLLGFELRTLDPVVPTPVQIGEFTVEPDELSDIVLLSLDGDGVPNWVRHFGGAGDQFLISASACGDGLAITGTTQNGMIDVGDGPIEGDFVAVFDGAGELVWSRTIALGGESPHVVTRAATCDASGSLSMTGTMRDGVDFGGGLLVPNDVFDGFVVRYSPTGEHVWSQLFGNVDSSEISGNAIALTPGGELVVVGSFSGTVDFGGGPLSADAGDDVLVVEYDGDGNHLWSRQIGPGSLQYGFAVAVADDGSIAVGGIFLDTIEIGADTHTNVFPDANEEVDGTLYDGFVATLAADGTPMWSTALASMLDDFVSDLAFDANGALIVGATLSKQLAVRVYEGGADGWAWDSSSGTWSWPRFAIAADGAVVLGSSVEGEVDLGTGVLPAHGGPDVFVSRLVR